MSIKHWRGKKEKKRKKKKKKEKKRKKKKERKKKSDSTRICTRDFQYTSLTFSLLTSTYFTANESKLSLDIS